uniref:RNase NYN domain-containing protein n=1 Tax=Panagrolaimus superbus TaxID=310955 RepID=A0A914YTP0_9BILA
MYNGFFYQGITPSLPDAIEKLPRLIIIDGFNIMHHFKTLDYRNSVLCDDSMCPIILIPLLLKWAQEGFSVRVVLRNMPDENKITHSYILHELERMGLLLYGLTDDIEADDLLMLKLAKKYGALIITRDQFRNHKGCEKVAEEYTVEYEQVRTNVTVEMLKKCLYYNSKVAIHDSKDRFYANQDDKDYELVKEAATKYPLCSPTIIHVLSLLQLYIYNSIRFMYNLGISKQVIFLQLNDKFPMEWGHFLQRYYDWQLIEDKKEKAKSRNEVIEEKREYIIDPEDCYLKDDE